MLADKARKYQKLLAWMSTEEFKEMIAKNRVNTSEVTVEDIKHMVDIHGEPEILLQGKMQRKSPIRHPKGTKLPLPIEIYMKHKHLNLYTDTFLCKYVAILIDEKR